MKTNLNKSNVLIYKLLMSIVWLIVFSLFLVSPAKSFAQNTIQPEFSGTWVLDSVQLKVIFPDSVVQKTVLAGEKNDFDSHWMQQFTLKTSGKADYQETDQTISGVSYFVKDRSGNSGTLVIDGVPDMKELNVQFLSDTILLYTNSFSTGYNYQNIEVSWNMFYHKSKQ